MKELALRVKKHIRVSHCHRYTHIDLQVFDLSMYFLYSGVSGEDFSPPLKPNY